MALMREDARGYDITRVINGNNMVNKAYLEAYLVFTICMDLCSFFLSWFSFVALSLSLSLSLCLSFRVCVFGAHAWLTKHKDAWKMGFRKRTKSD